jgi:hypothetical protein
MRAFEVHLNGRKLCVAGVGKAGVLTAILDYVGGQGSEETALTVGGLLTDADEHVRWVKRRKLKTGDEIHVTVLESKSADSPKMRQRRDPKADLKEQQRYVLGAAKEWGWAITVSKPTRRQNTIPKR